MAKKDNFTKPEFTFGELSIELLLLKSLKDNLKMIGVLFIILRVHQDIINENNDELVLLWVKDTIH